LSGWWAEEVNHSLRYRIGRRSEFCRSPFGKTLFVPDRNVTAGARAKFKTTPPGGEHTAAKRHSEPNLGEGGGVKGCNR
jgi:hypothetical protein